LEERKKLWHSPSGASSVSDPMFRVAARLRFIEPQLPSLVDQPFLTVEVKHLTGSKTLRHATVRVLA
jgi:hypothetical protein